jgi:hypothetical protein
VWLHAILFRYVAKLEADPAVNVASQSVNLGIGYSAPLTAREIYNGISGTVDLPLAAYALWPLQIPLVRDLLASRRDRLHQRSGLYAGCGNKSRPAIVGGCGWAVSPTESS